jgi:hypothetical protein
MIEYIYEINLLAPDISYYGDALEILDVKKYKKISNGEESNFDHVISLDSVETADVGLYIKDGIPTVGVNGYSSEETTDKLHIVWNKGHLNNFFISTSLNIRINCIEKTMPYLKKAESYSKFGYLFSMNRNLLQNTTTVYSAFIGRVVSLFDADTAFKIMEDMGDYLNELLTYTSRRSSDYSRTASFGDSFFINKDVFIDDGDDHVPLFFDGKLIILSGEVTGHSGWLGYNFEVKKSVEIVFSMISSDKAKQSLYALYGGAGSVEDTINIGGDIYPNETDTKYSGLSKALNDFDFSGRPELEDFIIGTAKKDSIIHEEK